MTIRRGFAGTIRRVGKTLYRKDGRPVLGEAVTRPDKFRIIFAFLMFISLRGIILYNDFNIFLVSSIKYCNKD